MEYRYSHVEAKTDTGPNMRKIEEQFGLTTARYKRTESFRRIQPEKLAEEVRTGNTSDLLLLDVRDVDEFESFRLRVSSHPPCVHAARHVFRRLRLATVRHSTTGCCADLGTACGVFRGLRLSFEGGASFNGNPAQPAQTHSKSAPTFLFFREQCTDNVGDQKTATCLRCVEVNPVARGDVGLKPSAAARPFLTSLQEC